MEILSFIEEDEGIRGILRDSGLWERPQRSPQLRLFPHKPEPSPGYLNLINFKAIDFYRRLRIGPVFLDHYK